MIDKLVGKGGHAEVYKGCLGDGQLVAVKRLIKRESEEERIGDFLSELGIIAHVNHPNAAQLLGFSVEGGLHLVLQFSPHGSLASLLHGKAAAASRNIILTTKLCSPVMKTASVLQVQRRLSIGG